MLTFVEWKYKYLNIIIQQQYNKKSERNRFHYFILVSFFLLQKQARKNVPHNFSSHEHFVLLTVKFIIC